MSHIKSVHFLHLCVAQAGSNIWQPSRHRFNGPSSHRYGVASLQSASCLWRLMERSLNSWDI